MTPGRVIGAAFSMFSAIPVPQPRWDAAALKWVLCAFPLVGLVCGLSWWVISCLPVPPLVRGTLLCVMPVIITGGIHLDGYADVSDALASHADEPTRQRILRDPHSGAFAIIRLAVYFLVFEALCVSFEPTTQGLICMGAGFVLSRSLSGWAVATLPIAPDSSLVQSFASAAQRRAVRWILGVLSVALMTLQTVAGLWAGFAMAAAAIIVLGWCAYIARSRFGGLSGDINGWFLQKCEFWMLAAWMVVQWGRGAL